MLSCLLMYKTASTSISQTIIQIRIYHGCINCIFEFTYTAISACGLQVSKGEFGLMFSDGSKFGRAEQLHMALLGLWGFHKREGRLPEAGNLVEAEEVVKLSAEVRFVRSSVFPLFFFLYRILYSDCSTHGGRQQQP